MSEVTVRLAGPGEYRRAGELTRDAYVTDGFEEAGSGYADTLADGEHRGANAQLYVAVDPEGVLLGTVTYSPFGTPYAEISAPGEAEFRMLAVAAHARRRGIAEALVRHLLTRATEDGMDRLVLSSASYMTTAHRLYERLGFTRAPHRDWRPLPHVLLYAYQAELKNTP